MTSITVVSYSHTAFSLAVHFAGGPDILATVLPGSLQACCWQLLPRLMLAVTESHALAMLLPLCALLLPIAMTLYIVRKAQRVTDTDRVAIWFSCLRFMRWLLLGTLLAWWVATDLVRGRQWF